MGNYKLLALDLDGTLLDSNERISAVNLRSVRRAREAGVRVVVITGRSTPSAGAFIKTLGLPDPFVAYNGAVIQQDGRVLRSITLDYHTVHKTVRTLQELRHEPVLYDTRDRRYYQEEGGLHHGFLSLSRGLEHTINRVQDLLSVRWRDIVRMSVFTGEEEVRRLERDLPLRLGASLRTTYTFFPLGGFWIYEILDAGSSKSGALQYLCGMFGLDRSQVAAVGDNGNDLDMITWAGLGVAMRNGMQDIREQADYVTERTNDQHGVAEVIERFILP